MSNGPDGGSTRGLSSLEKWSCSYIAVPYGCAAPHARPGQSLPTAAALGLCRRGIATLRADATDVLGVGRPEGAVAVLDAAGLRELHRLVGRLSSSRVAGLSTEGK
jgi:hypothetical protein